MHQSDHDVEVRQITNSLEHAVDHSSPPIEHSRASIDMAHGPNFRAAMIKTHGDAQTRSLIMRRRSVDAPALVLPDEDPRNRKSSEEHVNKTRGRTLSVNRSVDLSKCRGDPASKRVFEYNVDAVLVSSSSIPCDTSGIKSPGVPLLPSPPSPHTVRSPMRARRRDGECDMDLLPHPLPMMRSKSFGDSVLSISTESAYSGISSPDRFVVRTTSQSSLSYGSLNSGYSAYSSTSSVSSDDELYENLPRPTCAMVNDPAFDDKFKKLNGK